MVSKAKIFDHIDTHYPLTELGQLGVDLGGGSLDRDAEFYRLGTVVAGLNPESDLVSKDFVALEATEGKLASTQVLPFTLNCVRRAVLYRNVPESATVDPEITDTWESQDGRGIWNDDGKVEAYGSGILLTAFLNGLHNGGVPLQTSRAIVRNQIEHVLATECDGSGSYTAISATLNLYRIMEYASLHTPVSRLAQIRRSGRILKAFGLEITDL